MNHKQPLDKILSEYQPKPGKRFYLRMENAPWAPKRKKMSSFSTRSFRFGWQIAVAVLLVLAALSLSLPGVRASLSAWLGLSVAPSNQMPATSITLAAITPSAVQDTAPAVVSIPSATQPNALPTALPSPTPVQSTASRQKPAEVDQLAAQVGWNILTPAVLPDGYKFLSAYYDTNHQMVILTYEISRLLPGATDPSLTSTKTITVLQAQKNDFVPMQVSPDSKVTDITVNGQAASYVVGAWDTEFVKDDKDPNGGKMVSTWRNDLAVQNIFWQVGSVYVTIITDDEGVSQQALIDMAASVQG